MIYIWFENITIARSVRIFLNLCTRSANKSGYKHVVPSSIVPHLRVPYYCYNELYCFIEETRFREATSRYPMSLRPVNRRFSSRSDFPKWFVINSALDRRPVCHEGVASGATCHRHVTAWRATPNSSRGTQFESGSARKPRGVPLKSGTCWFSLHWLSKHMFSVHVSTDW